MRKTLIALMFAAALPTVAMAMPEGQGPMGPMDGPRHGAQMHDHGKGPYSQLDLSREQREQIRKIMGEQMHERKQLVDKYLEKLSPADQKAEAEVRALLKPDQQQKFDAIQKKQAERKAEWAEFKAWKAQQPQKAQ